MSLTKDDLQQISKIVGDTLREIVFPYIDAKIDELRDELRKEIDALRGEISANRSEIGTLRNEIGTLRTELSSLRTDMNDHVISLHSQDEKILSDIGYYFELCTPKEDFVHLKKDVKRLRGRVSRLEMVG